MTQASCTSPSCCAEVAPAFRGTATQASLGHVKQLPLSQASQPQREQSSGSRALAAERWRRCTGGRAPASPAIAAWRGAPTLTAYVINGLCRCMGPAGAVQGGLAAAAVSEQACGTLPLFEPRRQFTERGRGQCLQQEPASAVHLDAIRPRCVNIHRHAAAPRCRWRAHPPPAPGSAPQRCQSQTPRQRCTPAAQRSATQSSTIQPAEQSGMGQLCLYSWQAP